MKVVNKHTEGRTEVSSLTWLFGFGVSWFISYQVVKSIYELNDSSLNNSGLIAVGAVMAVIYFSLTSKASLNKIGRGLLIAGIGLYGLIVIPVEIFSLFANNVSNSGSEELSQIREKKERAIKKIEKLEFRQELNNQSKTMTGAQKAYKNGQIDLLIEPHEKNANLIIPSNQGKAFGDLAGWLGIKNIEPIYKTVVAALLVFVMPLLNIARNGTWCGLTLLVYKLQSWFTDWLMKEKTTEIKTATKPDVDIKGTRAETPTDASPFDVDYEAAKEWVSGHKTGQRVFVGRMKKACKGGANWQHEAILSGLKDDGLLQKKDNGGTSPLYYKRKPEIKQQIINQFENTRDFLKLVPVK